jgi:hypothetical protein
VSEKANPLAGPAIASEHRCEYVEHDRLREENERLREALRPLAALAEHYDDDPRMGICVVVVGHDRVRLTGHDAHVARAALANPEAEG